jgi:hypothetical protein
MGDERNENHTHIQTVSGPKDGITKEIDPECVRQFEIDLIPTAFGADSQGIPNRLDA